jgi:hypothetical protein
VKHRRSIDLAAPFPPAHHRIRDGEPHETLKGLSEWEVLGARCPKCGRTAWLDKRLVLREWGDGSLLSFGQKLRCTCGNREGNVVLVGALPR